MKWTKVKNKINEFLYGSINMATAKNYTAINAHFDIEMPTLVKSGKQDLQKLASALGLDVVAQ